MVPIHLRKGLELGRLHINVRIVCDKFEPAFLEPLENSWITLVEYTTSLMEEMILRTPLEGTGYQEDNAKIYQILQGLLGGSS